MDFSLRKIMLNLFKISRLRNIDQSHEITYVQIIEEATRKENRKRLVEGGI